jgi:hypothetical protein
MKKILLFLLLIASPVWAVSIEVEALQDFSTVRPAKTLRVQTTTNIYFDELLIPQGAVLTGSVFDVRSPKRLKQNASFSFIPTSYSVGNKQTSINGKFIGKYAATLDKGKLATNAALSAGNHLIMPFLSTGFHLVKGAVKNEEDNRLKSSAIAAYEASPLSYVEKGKDLEIRKGDVFVLKFHENDDEDKNDGYKPAPVPGENNE